jgi:orotate phosphoribosyltransferase-like protein
MKINIIITDCDTENINLSLSLKDIKDFKAELVAELLKEMTTQEIADMLNISVNTVRYHYLKWIDKNKISE